MTAEIEEEIRKYGKKLYDQVHEPPESDEESLRRFRAAVADAERECTYACNAAWNEYGDELRKLINPLIEKKCKALEAAYAERRRAIEVAQREYREWTGKEVPNA